MKRILLTTALAFAVSNVSAENLRVDPKDLVVDVAEQYIKNFDLPLPKIADVPMPEQLELGWKKSQYQFQNGAVLNLKTRDPLGRINVTYGNQNYQITQDRLTWSLTKQLNQDKFDQSDLKKFLD